VAAISPDGGVPASLAEIAGLVREASGAFVCAIAWDSDDGAGVAFAPEQCGRWHDPAQSILAALARHIELSGAQRSSRRVLPKPELAALLCGNSASAAAYARRYGAAQVRIAVLAPVESSARELEKIAELGCRAALAALGEREHAAARTFWRRQGADAAEKYSQARAELADYHEREQAIADLIARTRQLQGRERFASLGKFLARSGPFEHWMIALAGPQGLEIVASGPSTASTRRESGNPRKCLEQVAIADGNALWEPRFLHPPYICVPFDSGAIVLSARIPISDGERARLAATVARLAPILKAWRLELELETQRMLTRRLAYRMFSAVDQERARIARDLHDDHAQLITATRIALQGGSDEARAMVNRIEHEVRRKIHELKPANLGRVSLAHALSVEAARLNGAGIEATVSGAAVAARLSRPVQNLCWQFAREALANVIRHAHATRVELAVARRNGLAVISVTDNGSGIAKGAADSGSGLTGMRERLSLIGGCLRIHSRPSATVLTAEIPEPL
jgi:signal transduction histidine kinase